MACFSSAVMRWSGWLTPWRMLWTFLVILKTPGRGLGTLWGVSNREQKASRRLEGGFMALTIPGQIDTHQTSEADQCVTHESDTAPLGSGAKKGHADVIPTKLFSISQHALPGARTARVLVVLQGSEMGAETSISLDDASESNLQKRNKRGTKVPKSGCVSSSLLPLSLSFSTRTGGKWDSHDALAGHGISLLVNALGIPETLLLVVVIRTHHDGHNVQL